MKRNTSAMITVAVLLIAAIAYFTSRSSLQKTEKPVAVNLVGTWQLDTIQAPANAGEFTRQLAAAMNEAKQEQSIVYRFTADSLHRSSIRDQISERYYVKDSVLYIGEDSSFTAYRLLSCSDSMVRFLSPDSSLFALRRK